MEDLKLKAKLSVLDEIKKMFEDKDVDLLKSKSPKFAKVDIQSDDPALAEKLKNKLIGGEDEEHELSESPEMEHSEDMNPSLDMQDDMSDEDEMKKKLLEMYNKLK